jgi:KTSC domain
MNLVPLVSSNLAAVGYDPAIGEMQIEFRSGRVYVYRVPYTVYEGLMSAGSKGRYFSYYIRWRYWGRRIR